MILKVLRNVDVHCSSQIYLRIVQNANNDLNTEDLSNQRSYLYNDCTCHMGT